MYRQGATLKKYKRDIVLIFSRVGLPAYFNRGKREGTRGVIQEYSKRSERRFRLWMRNTEDIWKAFVRLSYPDGFPVDGRQVKKHLHVFLMRLNRRGINWAWVFEFQPCRGAPHIHLVLTERVDKGELAEMWDTVIGNNWKARGDKASASTSVQKYQGLQTLCYMVSYMGKESQKQVPESFSNVGRFWGCSRGLVEHEDIKVLGRSYRDVARKTRLLRRWYIAKWRLLGIKWRWGGLGFIVWDGRAFYDQVMGLRC